MPTERIVLACSLVALALTTCRREEASLPPAPPVQSQPSVQTGTATTVQSQAVPPSPRSSSAEVFIQVVAGESLVIGHGLPLTDAVSNLQTKRVKALLEAGADANVREENATSWPPIAFAMKGEAPSDQPYDPNAQRDTLELPPRARC